MTRPNTRPDAHEFTVSPDAQRGARLHSPPQRPAEGRPIDALMEALRDALDLSFQEMTPELVEKLRRRLGQAVMEAKTVRSRLQVLEGR